MEVNMKYATALKFGYIFPNHMTSKDNTRLDRELRVREEDHIVKGVEDGWLLQFVSEIVKLGFKLD